MGFSTVFSGMASNMVTNASSFLGDIMPVVAVFFGVAVVGFLVSLLARFVNR